MDQQQLQTARAALWHQTATDSSAALRTFDDASRWLDSVGLCLFLPRHTQLPAPAPSFLEACLGAPSLSPSPAVIAHATGLASRLIEERRVIPLNLLGGSSDQPDFLVTPEVLPWVAAVRGDRHWKSAPAGRTPPLVTRAFEVLDRAGELTAVELRSAVGHEISEAAAVRALIELWTTLRAMPVYVAAQPARWTLLKNRYPAQLATGANTAQITALSALLSIYLRSAVAARAEEAEVFLSPLTARSRIREVIHGMMAARQLGITTMASQTLLFVEGSLPDAPPATGAEPLQARPSAPSAQPPRKAPRPLRFERPRPTPPRPSEGRPSWKKLPAAADAGPPANRGAAAPPSADHRVNRGERAGERFRGSRPASAPRFVRGPAKPWQNRGRGESPPREFSRRDRPASFGDTAPRSNRPPRRDGSSGETRSGQRRPHDTSRGGNNRDQFRRNRKPFAARDGRPSPPRPPAPKSKFRKPIPYKPNPRKNRNQEENPE